jgi:hypothetical protein
MSLDDRFREARGELDHAFGDDSRPDFGRVRARQRRRRAAAGGAGALALLVVVAVTLTRIGGDDNPRVSAIGTTTEAPEPSTTVAPSTTTTVPAPATTTPNSTTPATAGKPPAGHLSVSGSEPPMAVAVRDDGTLVRLRTDTGAVVAAIAKEGDPTTTTTSAPAGNVITDAAMGPDGRVLYTDCCEPAVGNVFDVRTNSQQMPLEGTAAGSASMPGMAPAVSPNGKYLAVFADTNIDVYSLATGKRIRTIDASTAKGLVSRLAMSDDGAVALQVPNGAASAQSVVIVLSPVARNMSDEWARAGWEFGSAAHPAFMPDARVVYADQSEDGRTGQKGPTRLHLLQPGAATIDQDVTYDLPFDVADIGVSDNGWLIVTGTDHVVRSFDGTTWREIARGYSAADW